MKIIISFAEKGTKMERDIVIKMRDIRHQAFESDDEQRIFFDDILQDIIRYEKAIAELDIKKAEHADMDEIVAFDKVRTAAHNKVIDDFRILNRLAQQAGLPPIVEPELTENNARRLELAIEAFHALAFLLEDL